MLQVLPFRALLATLTLSLTFVGSACAQVPEAAGRVGFFAGLGAACSSCKQRCCDSPFGEMLGAMTQPLDMMTGGILHRKCPPTGPASGPAAAIAQNQADAKARAAAVRYLATVDCHWYPEAEKQLIASLRADPSECVRWEAAKALQTGCCCNKATIDALTITVSGSDRDGNPSENSLRVKVEAYIALQNCIQRVDALPEPDVELLPAPEASVARGPTPYPASGPSAASAGDEQPTLAPAEETQTGQVVSAGATVASPPLTPQSYEQLVKQRTMPELVAEARKALALAAPKIDAPAAQLPRPGQRNLISLWMNSADKSPAR